MGKKHANIPVFIPHLGCPHACVFCDQRSISGHGAFALSTVRQEIESALSTLTGDLREREIAFFGGSFTGIDRTLMIRLLDIAQEYVERGQVESIRLSTRPDYIDEEILEILSRYAVRTIELGLQSFSDRVLEACRRGHDSQQARQACRLLKAAGFELVGQMMIGLPRSEGTDEEETAREICELGADAARVYPTVVFYGTELCRMAQTGQYTLLTQKQAVERTADVLEVFDRYRVPVLRVGLCASESLSDPETVFGGASDSAMGEMARGEVFYRRMTRLLEDSDRTGTAVCFAVPTGALSQAVGQRGVNRERLCARFGLRGMKVTEDGTLCGYEVRLRSGSGNAGTHQNKE